MEVKLLKLLRSKFHFTHNNHYWFATYKYNSIRSNSGPHVNSDLKLNILYGRMINLITKHNDYIGLSKRQLNQLGIHN